MNRLDLTEIRDKLVKSPVTNIVPSIKINSLVTSLTNCIESQKTGVLMSDDHQLYAISLFVVESLELKLTRKQRKKIVDTIWSILCWLRQSLSSMMYLRFDVSEIVRHDLDIVAINQLMPMIEYKLVDFFEGKTKYFKHAIRYLLVLNEMLHEKGAL